MRWILLLSRLAATGVLAAGLMRIALDSVPGLTAASHIRMMLFVFVGPWVVAALAAHPARLLGVLRATLLGSPGEGMTTVRVLEFLGGLTVTAGAIGALGTMFAFNDALGFTWDTSAIRADLSGFVAAVVLPPAFAVIVRLFFYEPVIWLLRSRFAPENQSEEGKLLVRKAAITAGVIVVGALAVKVLFLRPVKLPEKPTWDITVTAIGIDPDTREGSPDLGPAIPGAPEPIWIELDRDGDGEIRCLVEGEKLAGLPGGYAGIASIVRRLAKAGGERPIDIGAASRVPLLHLVNVLDACLALRRPEAKGGAGLYIPEIRLVVPTMRPFAVRQRLRFVFVQPRPGLDSVWVKLPHAREVEALRGYAADAPPVRVMWDLETRFSDVYVDRESVDLDELEAFLYDRARPHRNKTTGLSDMTAVICSDKGAPVHKLYDILTILAGKNLRVRDVQIAVTLIDPDKLH